MGIRAKENRPARVIRDAIPEFDMTLLYIQRSSRDYESSQVAMAGTACFL